MMDIKLQKTHKFSSQLIFSGKVDFSELPFEETNYLEL